MRLRRYFETDDGSLPEIEFEFESPEKIVQAFERFFCLGAVDATANGGCKLWNIRENKEIPFSGPQASRLLQGGEIEPFHIVLSGISLGGTSIPELGVELYPAGMTIDYRMGPEWGEAQIRAIAILLRDLEGIGGKISVPWWGEDGNHDFRIAMDGT